MGLVNWHKYNVKLTLFLPYPSETFSYRDVITANGYVLQDQNQYDQ